MSYSLNKQKISSVPGFSFSAGDFAYLAASDAAVERDHAVEKLIDEIREVACLFRFKEPLGPHFDTAADHALNCLDATSDWLPRRVNNWIRDCLKCCDCLCLVFLQDVLKMKVTPRSSDSCYERDVYQTYLEHEDTDVRRIGSSLDQVYELCRNPLEHSQVERNGRREIKKVGNKELRKKYTLSRELFSAALDQLVPGYCEGFPDCCVEDMND